MSFLAKNNINGIIASAPTKPAEPRQSVITPVPAPNESVAVPPGKFVVAPVAAPPVVSPPPAGVPAMNGLSNFEKAIRYVMTQEDGKNWDHDTGEFTDDPRDPGGATVWGIIKTEYEGFLGRSLTVDEVKTMPRGTAVAIYKKNFWIPIRGDEYSRIEDAVAIMDVAVNKGLGGCMVILRNALHQPFPERFGDDALRCVNSQEPFLPFFEKATENYIEARIAQYPNMEWARRGWMNRCQRMTSIPAFLAAL